MAIRTPVERLFLEHHGKLRRWARRFTTPDRDAAEDLLHDTFVHLALAAPDLDAVQDRPAFLYVVMRNLHLTRRRRESRSTLCSVSPAGYDPAGPDTCTRHPDILIRAREELRAICDFACARKERSKLGSLLILRFFHGYHPGEIALVMRTTRMAVNAGLKKVRSEIRLHLEGIRNVARPDRARVSKPVEMGQTREGDFHLELRATIFASRRGTCPSRASVENFYSLEKGKGPPRLVLAHIVSCALCLESVGLRLGLAPFAGRHPMDAVGRDSAFRDARDNIGGAPKTEMCLSNRDAEKNHHDWYIRSASGVFKDEALGTSFF